jgi:cell division protein FtsB
MDVIITLLCILISLLLFVGAFYLSKHVVERQHRVHVLEDAYREATDEIQALTQTVQDKEREIELILFEAQQNGQRMDRPRSWNPSDPLNSNPRQ